jgi:hypothetical protein
MGQLEQKMSSGTGFGMFGDKRERKGSIDVIAGRGFPGVFLRRRREL